VCVYFDSKTLVYAEKVAGELRKSGKKIEICYESDKIKKQMKYASSLNAPYVVICGEEEMNKKTVVVKNMKTQEQITVKRTASEIIDAIDGRL